jgi:hypothetical protein
MLRIVARPHRTIFKAYPTVTIIAGGILRIRSAGFFIPSG